MGNKPSASATSGSAGKHTNRNGTGRAEFGDDCSWEDENINAYDPVGPVDPESP